MSEPFDREIFREELKTHLDNEIPKSELIREEISRRFALAREALALVRLDNTLLGGKISKATMNKVDEAFNALI